jgi:hypothetical protein
MGTASDEAGEVRHVHHEDRADLVGDLAEALEIEDARIGRAPGDDHLRAALTGEARNLVHVDPMVVAAHAVGHHLEPLAGDVDGRAMGEMPAGGEVETHEGIARLHQRHEGRRVGRRPGMRLDVRESASEELRHALDGEVFGNVDELAAAVVAPPGQAFRIFVGEHRALRLQHRPADDVFRRDELDLVALAAKLEADRLGDLRIGLGKGRGEHIPRRRGGFRNGCLHSKGPSGRPRGVRAATKIGTDDRQAADDRSRLTHRAGSRQVLLRLHG